MVWQNKIKILMCLLCASFGGLSPVQGQDDKIGAISPLSHGVQFQIKSDFIDEVQTVHVYVPDDYQDMADHVRYPVIYTLDGWALSKSVSGIVHHLGNTASMPKAIVVAVNSHQEYSYGPELYNSQSGWNGKPEDRLTGFSGGKADDYLKFIEDELVPHIDSAYRTNDFRMIIGMSPTATFALHSFWKAPKLFNAHIVFAATDVLGMGYTPDTTFVDKIAESMAQNPGRKGYLYIASAQREADRKPIRLKTIAELERAMQPYQAQGFHVRAEHIKGYGHYPMAVPGLLRAMDLVFPLKDFGMSGRFNDIIRSGEGNAFLTILKMYEKLSAQVGFNVRPNVDLRRNASSLRVAGNNLRGRKRYAEAIELYEYWIKDSPHSVKAHAGLGMTLYQSGQKAAGIAAMTRAVDFAVQQKNPNVDDYRKRLEDMQK